jgi:hypothetical protein
MVLEEPPPTHCGGIANQLASMQTYFGIFKPGKVYFKSEYGN